MQIVSYFQLSNNTFTITHLDFRQMQYCCCYC